MDNAIKKLTRTARIIDSAWLQGENQIKSMVFPNRQHAGRGRIMDFGDREIIRFFKLKTMQQTRSRGRGYVH